MACYYSGMPFHSIHRKLDMGRPCAQQSGRYDNGLVQIQYIRRILWKGGLQSDLRICNNCQLDV